MARPREFDADAVLQRAAELFRLRGYAALGVAELTEQLRLSRSSLYGAFGSKQGLWLAALERYRDEEIQRLLAVLHDRDAAPLQRIHHLVHMVAESALADGSGGCLIVNAACERGGRDGPTSEIVDDQLDTLERELCRVLELALADGSLRSDVDPADLAATISTLIQGLRVVGRVEGAKRRVHSALREIDRQLDGALVATP